MIEHCVIEYRKNGDRKIAHRMPCGVRRARMVVATPVAPIQTTHQRRSTTMYAINEALAKDRIRNEQRRSREARVARELAAQRRWHRVSVRASAAEARHAHRAGR